MELCHTLKHITLADLGGVPGARPPLRDPILSFSHTFLSKSAHVRGPRPPLTGPRPPYGKSWIRHCITLKSTGKSGKTLEKEICQPETGGTINRMEGTVHGGLGSFTINTKHPIQSYLALRVALSLSSVDSTLSSSPFLRKAAIP